jgi:hypothetical protein
MKHLNIAAATRVRAAAMIVTATLALLATGCGSAGPGSSGAASIGSSSSNVAPGDAKLAFAQCMRAHGVHDYPDPGSKVGSNSGGDLDPYNPTFEAAYQACQSLLPPGQQTLQQMHQQLAEDGLGFARCMRAHGITGFPDPNAEGQFPETQMHGLGKGSPQFTAAQNACHHYLNPSDGGGK